MKKTFKSVVFAAAMVAAWSTMAAPTITDVTACQRYPWNGKFDISYTATGVDEACQARGQLAVLKVFAVERTTQITNVAELAYLSGDTKMSNGTHRLVWDMDAQGCFRGLVSTNFEVFVSAEDAGGVQLWENGPYWAECNVGASKPEEYGYCFWWGDTVGYKRNANNNGWVSVKDGTSFSFESGNCPTHGKDNAALQSAAYIDASGNLVAAHDAAAAHLGAPWRMPTDAEFSALINNCDTTWTQRNGVWGWLVTGRGAYASKSIFLPAAGYGLDSYLDFTGSRGDYWSSTPNSDNSNYAWGLGFNSSNFRRSDDYRDGGQSVRPVREFAK